jgi:hypothetical protein
MALKELDQIINNDFSWRSGDLKKHVFIYVRKQIGQEMESVSAC